MREVGKLARDTNLTLYGKWDHLAVFSNIVSSEQSQVIVLASEYP